eukprot:2067992-Pleurochrysis_carterae.AAC.1
MRCYRGLGALQGTPGCSLTMWAWSRSFHRSAPPIWRLDRERLDKAILINCIDPVGWAGRGKPRPAPTWGIASSS